MNAARTPLSLESGRVLGWISESLRAGGSLSTRIERLRPAQPPVLISQWSDEFSEPDLRRGSHLSAEAAVDGTVDYLVEEYGSRDWILVVEDDLRRRGDPHLSGDVAFIGEEVIRWERIDCKNRARLRSLLRMGASGYPFNGFVLAGSPDELRLHPFVDVAASAVDQMMASVCAILVAAMDGEAFVAVAQAPLDPRAVAGACWNA